jgi:hypothetical protein
MAISFLELNKSKPYPPTSKRFLKRNDKISVKYQILILLMYGFHQCYFFKPKTRANILTMYFSKALPPHTTTFKVRISTYEFRKDTNIFVTPLA